MTAPNSETNGEDGYLLIGLVVVCFLLLLFLSVAAPRVAKQLERDREVESEHRAEQYVRAIQLYYRRNNRFPNSVDELLGNGASGISSAVTIKYLRQKYKDPLTKDDFRLIHVGEAKTEVKGFFGEPLEGLPVGNLGAVAGLQSNLGGSANQSASGSASGSSAGGSSSGFLLGGSSATTANTAGTATTGLSTVTTSGTQAAGITGSPAGMGSESSTDATTFAGSKGAFVGVGTTAKGHGLVEWNGSENLEDWEFLYDPRVELLKARVSLLGGSPAANGSGFAPASNMSGFGTGISSGTGTSSSTGTSSGTGISSGTGTSLGSGAGTGTTPSVSTGISSGVPPAPQQ